MIRIKQLVLDVLKPHHPDIMEFASTIAEQGAGYRVNIRVIEVDEKTETLDVTINGENLELEKIVDSINSMGASVHSIDSVDVVNTDGD